MAQTKEKRTDHRAESAPGANDACQSGPAEPNGPQPECRFDGVEKIEMAGFFSHFVQGTIEIVPAVAESLTKEEIFYGLARHGYCDWGDVEKREWEANDAAVKGGGTLFSRYRTSRGTKFWIVTDGNRSRTTVLLPLDH